MRDTVMKHTTKIIPMLLAAGLTLGCTSTDRKSAVEQKQNITAAAQADRAKTETKEAARAMQDYIYAQKAEFVTEMKKEMVEIQAELDRLSAKAEGLDEKAKADARVAFDATHKNLTRAEEQLDQAQNATEATWDKVKADFEKSRAELKDSFEVSRRWLSKKIAP